MLVVGQTPARALADPQCDNAIPPEVSAIIDGFNGLVRSPVGGATYSVRVTFNLGQPRDGCGLDSWTISRSRVDAQSGNVQEYESPEMVTANPPRGGLIPQACVFTGCGGNYVWTPSVTVDDPGDTMTYGGWIGHLPPLKPDTTYEYSVCEYFVDHLRDRLCSAVRISLPAVPPAAPQNVHIQNDPEYVPPHVYKPGWRPNGVEGGSQASSATSLSGPPPNVWNLLIQWVQPASAPSVDGVVLYGAPHHFEVQRQDDGGGWSPELQVNGQSVNAVDSVSMPLGTTSFTVTYRVCAVGEGWVTKTPAVDPSMFFVCSQPTVYRYINYLSLHPVHP
jgi:hypothetical protein